MFVVRAAPSIRPSRTRIVFEGMLKRVNLCAALFAEQTRTADTENQGCKASQVFGCGVHPKGWRHRYRVVIHALSTLTDLRAKPGKLAAISTGVAVWWRVRDRKIVRRRSTRSTPHHPEGFHQTALNNGLEILIGSHREKLPQHRVAHVAVRPLMPGLRDPLRATELIAQFLTRGKDPREPVLEAALSLNPRRASEDLAHAQRSNPQVATQAYRS